MCQMHPDLMCAASAKTNIEQGQAAEFPPNPIMCQGLPAAFTDTHTLTVAWVPPYRRFDRPPRDQFSMHQSLIPPFDLAGLKLSGQCRTGFRGARHRHKPGRITIQSVHNSCPRHFGGVWKME